MGPLDVVKLKPLMERTSGRPEIMIGLVDGPVAIHHPDLAGADIREIPGTLSGTCAQAGSAACQQAPLFGSSSFYAKGWLESHPQHMTSIPDPGTGCYCLEKLDNVGTGPIGPSYSGICITLWKPVHDGCGNTYSNDWVAAREGYGRLGSEGAMCSHETANATPILSQV
jgi:hypothetical protein